MSDQPAAEMTTDDLFDLAQSQLDQARRTLATLKHLVIEGSKRTCGDPECTRPAHQRPARGVLHYQHSGGEPCNPGCVFP